RNNSRTMPNSKDRNIVKIAVEMDDQLPQLIEFDQKRPLKLIIADLCNTWSIVEPCDYYALKFGDTESKFYVTEKNRNEIKDGSVLRLMYSASVTASNLLEKIQLSVGEERKNALQRLVELSLDHTFANEFINKQGKDYIVTAIEDGSIKIEEGLGFALEAFVELMNHGIVSWDTVDEVFISKIANHVNLTQTKTDPKVLVNSLAILESIVTSSTMFTTRVEAEVTLPNLISHVQQNVHYPEIQQNAIALINALFIKSDLSKRKATAKTLGSRQIRDIILNSVISKSEGEGGGNVGSEMAHQLYILQSLILNLHEERMQMLPTTSSVIEDAKEKLNELRKLAFESELSCDRALGKAPLSSPSNIGNANNFVDNYMRLGFTSCKNPVEDFTTCPPGLLALDLMLYFARNYTDNYVKVVLENSCRTDKDHECPFARGAIEITSLLCQIFKIGETPSDEGKTFYRMFFKHDHPLEELFCICVPLLNKTWKEMRATVADFEKVFSVLRQQISRSLDEPKATESFETFKAKLSELTYSKIMTLWQKERTNREEWENKAKAILELRERVKPEIIELIKQQRLQFLTEGTLFVKYSNKGQRVKDKFWFCRLSTNYKVFYYGDTQENKVPSIDELSHKFPVVDIKMMLVGRDCPHMKDQKSKKSTYALAFSLIPDSDQEEALNFVASNEKIFDYWTDGINALLGNSMVSKETQRDLETLLSMDIKLRLLDTEGVTIPEVPPEIPPSPPNYDFNFKY
ncbi:engulfment and cell motility protein 1-like protein, partial [Dinothrombium tinctorium]